MNLMLWINNKRSVYKNLEILHLLALDSLPNSKEVLLQNLIYILYNSKSEFT